VGPLFVLVECGCGFRIPFDQRSRIAACWQGGREASELSPTLSAKTEKRFDGALVVLTPATAMDDAQLARLREKAGLSFEIQTAD